MAPPNRARVRPGVLQIAVSLLMIAGIVACQSRQPLPGGQPRDPARPTEAAATPAVPEPSATLAPVSAALTSSAAAATAPTAALAQATPTAAAVPTEAPAPVAAAGPTATTNAITAHAGPPVHIVIPDLELDAKVVEMGWAVVDTATGSQSEWMIPENEAGHHINSAQLGERGNIVISGHNNIYGRVFEAISLAWDDDHRQRVDDVTDRSNILDGRTVQLYNAAGQRFDYTVTAFYRMKDKGQPLEQRMANARFMQPTADAQLTLITCWPMTGNTHRLILVATPAGG